ncbi:MAG: hypothetical protein ABW000_08795 [Actinoplanes sp.]
MSDWEFKRRKRDEKRRAAVLALPVLPVRPHGTITGVRDADVLVSSSIGPAGTRVALFGGYGPDRDRLVLADLGPGRLRRRGEYRLALPDGSPLPAAQVVGRGPHLHVLAGRAWFRLDLDDLPEHQRL